MLAIIFDSVGFGEWFVLLAVILVVVGPKRLPETARKVGQYYSKFRRAADSFKRQLMDMDTEMNRAAESVHGAASDMFTPVDDTGGVDRGGAESYGRVEETPGGPGDIGESADQGERSV